MDAGTGSASPKRQLARRPIGSRRAFKEVPCRGGELSRVGGQTTSGWPGTRRRRSFLGRSARRRSPRGGGWVLIHGLPLVHHPPGALVPLAGARRTVSPGRTPSRCACISLGVRQTALDLGVARPPCLVASAFDLGLEEPKLLPAVFIEKLPPPIFLRYQATAFLSNVSGKSMNMSCDIRTPSPCYSSPAHSLSAH